MKTCKDLSLPLCYYCVKHNPEEEQDNCWVEVYRKRLEKDPRASIIKEIKINNRIVKASTLFKNIYLERYMLPVIEYFYPECVGVYEKLSVLL